MAAAPSSDRRGQPKVQPQQVLDEVPVTRRVTTWRRHLGFASGSRYWQARSKAPDETLVLHQTTFALLRLDSHPEENRGTCLLAAEAGIRDDHPMADVIFFDLDGTLVDHRSAVLETIGQIVQAAPNATAPPEELVTLWWTLEARHMREYLAGQCSFAEHHRRRLRSFLPVLGEPVPESPGLLDAWIAERYLSVFEESWRCYPDVQPCLETLKRLPRGPRLAVLTNGDPEQQRAKLARFGLLEYFEAVLTPTELGAGKPAAYAAACRRMRTDPAQAVNVGDMLESDVNAATRAGLTGIWLDRGIDFVTGGPSPTADDPVLRIEQLTDLPDHLSHTNA